MADETPALTLEIDEESGEVVYSRPGLSGTKFLLGPKDEVMEIMADFLARHDFRGVSRMGAGMWDRTEFEVEGPDGQGRYHVVQIEWHGGSRKVTVESLHASLDEASARAEQRRSGG